MASTPRTAFAYLIHQRSAKRSLATVEPNLDIAERIYQLEAIKRVAEPNGSYSCAIAGSSASRHGWPGYLQVKSAIDARHGRTNDELTFD